MELKVFVEQNPKVLLSEKKTRALLNDIYRNDQLSINLMMSAFSIGLITEMRESFPVDEFTKTRWAKKMVTDFGVSTEKAQWAIDNWIAVVDHKLLKEIDAAEELLKVDQEELRKKQEEEARILAEQERKRLEEEEQAREEARRSTPDARLKTRDDYNDYYINPSLEESDKYIYIPCGFGQGDNGFLICGIKKELICKHKDANVYALIYNYLTRSSNIREDDIPHCLQNIDTVYTLDYQTIYRLTIILLQMVRHNLVNGVLALNYRDDSESLKYAVKVINNYGVKAVSDNLKSWLSETSAFGCGDDITVLIAYLTENEIIDGLTNQTEDTLEVVTCDED